MGTGKMFFPVPAGFEEGAKYLFELPDGMLIETVLMRQHYGLSVCVTTQVCICKGAVRCYVQYRNV